MRARPSVKCCAASPLALSTAERGGLAADCQRGAAGPEGQGCGRCLRGHVNEPQPRARVLGHLRRGGLDGKDLRSELWRTQHWRAGWHRRRDFCRNPRYRCCCLLVAPLQEDASRAIPASCTHPNPLWLPM